MLKFYVLRRGNEFKIAHVNQETALRFHEQGWELGDRGPYESREEAEKYQVEWKANLLRLGSNT